jgi:hypothetical protein
LPSIVRQGSMNDLKVGRVRCRRHRKMGVGREVGRRRRRAGSLGVTHRRRGPAACSFK